MSQETCGLVMQDIGAIKQATESVIDSRRPQYMCLGDESNTQIYYVPVIDRHRLQVHISWYSTHKYLYKGLLTLSICAQAIRARLRISGRYR